MRACRCVAGEPGGRRSVQPRPGLPVPDRAGHGRRLPGRPRHQLPERSDGPGHPGASPAAPAGRRRAGGDRGPATPGRHPGGRRAGRPGEGLRPDDRTAAAGRRWRTTGRCSTTRGASTWRWPTRRPRRWRSSSTTCAAPSPPVRWWSRSPTTSRPRVIRPCLRRSGGLTRSCSPERYRHRDRAGHRGPRDSPPRRQGLGPRRGREGRHLQLHAASHGGITCRTRSSCWSRTTRRTSC